MLFFPSIRKTYQHLSMEFLAFCRANEKCLPYAFLFTPILALPAFFLHPDGFTWVMYQSFKKEITSFFKVVSDVKAVLREGSMATYMFFFWIAILCAGYMMVQQHNREILLMYQLKHASSANIKRVRKRKKKRSSSGTPSFEYTLEPDDMSDDDGSDCDGEDDFDPYYQANLDSITPSKICASSNERIVMPMHETENNENQQIEGPETETSLRQEFVSDIDSNNSVLQCEDKVTQITSKDPCQDTNEENNNNNNPETIQRPKMESKPLEPKIYRKLPVPSDVMGQTNKIVYDKKIQNPKIDQPRSPTRQAYGEKNTTDKINNTLKRARRGSFKGVLKNRSNKRNTTHVLNEKESPNETSKKKEDDSERINQSSFDMLRTSLHPEQILLVLQDPSLTDHQMFQLIKNGKIQQGVLASMSRDDFSRACIRTDVLERLLNIFRLCSNSFCQTKSDFVNSISESTPETVLKPNRYHSLPSDQMFVPKTGHYTLIQTPPPGFSRAQGLTQYSNQHCQSMPQDDQYELSMHEISSQMSMNVLD